MKVRIYASQEDPSLFVLIAEPLNPETLPAHVQSLLGPMVPFKRIELDATQPRVGLDMAAAQQDLLSKDFHICRAKILFERGQCQMAG